MRKLLSILFIAAGLAVSAADSMASDAGQDPTPNDNSQTPESLTNQINTKFVIEGYVDDNIPDSCYNIYITDIENKITDNDLAACVQVKNKRFRYETDIKTMKLGRLRAIFPGNKICAAWIEVYFIPGFTLALTVHDGYFDIFNNSEYGFMVNAWLNRGPLSTLYNTMGTATNTEHEELVMKATIREYRKLIADLQNQINRIYDRRPFNQKLVKEESTKLLRQIENINYKIEGIIDQYSKSNTKP